GGNDQVLVTDASGTVEWIDKSSFSAIADQVTITGAGTVGDPFKVEDLSIVTAKLDDDAVTNAKLADDAVQTENILNGTILTEDISSGGNDQVLVTDAAGTVVWVDKSSFAVLADQVTITGVGTVGDPFKVEDLSIVNSKLGPDAVTNAKLADDAVQLENIADGTVSGQVMQWDGTDWILVDLGSVTVTEVDGVIGNEVTNATDGTLVRSGAGTTVSPYTLDVSADGITNAELADDAVQTENILSGGNDQVLVTDASGTVEWIDKSSFSVIADQVTITGAGTVGDPFKVEDLSIVTAKLNDGAVTTIKLGNDAVTNAKLADDAVQTENILSGGNDQVLVTDASGTVEWIDKSSFSAIADQVTITGAGTVGDPFKVEDLSIVTAKLDDGAVTTIKLGDDAVTNAKLADDAVQTENILSGGNDQVLVTDASGTVEWIDKSSFSAIADQVTITGAGTVGDPFKVEDLSIVTAKLDDDAVTNAKLADDAVQLENIADGTVSGQVMQWDGTEWTLVDLGSVTVTENDGVIGNEVTNATDGTLVRSGAGTTVSPYTLDVSADGITNAELADNAVRTENILSGGNDQVLVTDATGTVEWVDKSILNSDNQTLGIAGDQLTISGGNTVTVPTADGSETIVTGGGINVVTGSGTTLDPYVITATEVDGSITNEVNTAFAVVGSDLSITDSNGTLTVPLSSLGTDDQNIDVLTLNATNNILTVGIENGND
ncbi:hypothetical protein QSE00_25075, partial [Arenibacter sp. M-2]|uniref:beta strand repeat-containing protein n=1 Tax=Arenibacter sp. M-2 TaxID=3053612 RepID=UPI00257005C1